MALLAVAECRHYNIMTSFSRPNDIFARGFARSAKFSVQGEVRMVISCNTLIGNVFCGNGQQRSVREREGDINVTQQRARGAACN